jgi:hypothetical protein
VLFSLARFEELDQIFIKVEEICKDPLDLVDCCCLQLISLSNRSRYEEGFALGIALLERLGIKYPQDELIDEVEAEIEKYYKYEHDGQIAKLEEKEPLSNPQGQSIAKLLNRITPAGFFFSPLAEFWAAVKSTNFMIERGITSWGLENSVIMMHSLIDFKKEYYKGFQ